MYKPIHNSTPPRIGVVMTAFNAAPFLKETISSILSQSFTDFEFIIVDNNSTDDSLAIIKTFKDSRIKLIENNQNLGQTGALNVGIHASQAPFIARMDADDICLPERLQRQYDYMEKNPHVGVLGSRAININENGKHIGYYNVPTHPSWIRSCLCASGDLTRWCLIHPSVMIRRSVLNKSGLYNEGRSVSGYPQDYNLWKRLLPHCDIHNLKQPLLKYRILSRSESRQFSAIREYRAEITSEQIRRHMPEFSEPQIKSLTRMLEFLPQKQKENPAACLSLFDQYFDKFTADRMSRAKQDYFKTKIKLYYLPQLRKTGKRTALSLLAKYFLRHPQWLFDPYFYSKIIKSGENQNASI